MTDDREPDVADAGRGHGRRSALETPTRKKDRSMHDTTADHLHHHRTAEPAS
jgi:hypothetical protein